MRKSKFHCPNCGYKITLHDYAKLMGSKGGQVKGPTKARTTEQARAAVNARWAKNLITDSKVSEILVLRAQGWKLRAIAEKFGISESGVSRIVSSQRSKQKGV